MEYKQNFAKFGQKTITVIQQPSCNNNKNNENNNNNHARARVRICWRKFDNFQTELRSMRTRS